MNLRLIADKHFGINPNTRDALGLDPYGLRKSDKPLQRTFAEAVNSTCLNKADLDFTKLDLSEAAGNYVPHILFIIWFGSAFDAQKQKFQRNAAYQLPHRKTLLTLLPLLENLNQRIEQNSQQILKM